VLTIRDQAWERSHGPWSHRAAAARLVPRI